MAIEFGKKMRSIREEKDWTLEEMAEKLGTTKQALSKYERGERTPKVTVAAKFAKILGVPLRELVGTDEAPESDQQEKAKPPRTIEARILAKGVDKLPEDQRQRALAAFRILFEPQYEHLFTKGTDEDET